MTLKRGVFLIVYVVTISLVTSVNVDNHSKEHVHHKLLQVTGNPLPVSQSSVASRLSSTSSQDYISRFPKSPGISPESTVSAQESPTSSQNVPVQQKPRDLISSQLPPVRESTSSSPKDTYSSKGINATQESVYSSVERIASSEESEDSSIAGISENVLHRVKRQQRRQRPNRNKVNGGGTAQGTSQPFCNQFGCNDNKQPVRPVRNSQCPSGTRFDRKTNRCRKLSGG